MLDADSGQKSVVDEVVVAQVDEIPPSVGACAVRYAYSIVVISTDCGGNRWVHVDVS